MRGIGLVLMLTLPLCAQPANQQKRGTLADWQTSYLKFAAEVLRTPETEDSNKFFGREVVYEGLFNEVRYDREDLDRKDPQLSINLPVLSGPVSITTFLHLRPSAVDSWKKVTKGTKVRIRGKVDRISRDPATPLGGIVFTSYGFFISDVELVGVVAGN
jgi:hypothetical protein